MDMDRDHPRSGAGRGGRAPRVRHLPRSPLERAPGLALLAILLALAGCLGGAGEPESRGIPEPPDAESDAAGPAFDLDPLSRPERALLDWFEVRAEGPWTTGSTYKLAVHVEDGSGYELVTDSEDAARRDHIWNNNPLIGHLDRDLNPTDGKPALVEWPLIHDRTWTSEGGMWDDDLPRTWSFVAHRAESRSTGLGSIPAYHIVGTAKDDDGGEQPWTITAIYAPELGFWAGYEVTAPGGRTLARYDVVASGIDHTGPLVVGSSETLVQASWVDSGDNPRLTEFDVPAGTTDLYVYADLTSAASSAAALFDPDGRLVDQAGPSTGGSSLDHLATDPEPGTWRIALEAVGAAGTQVPSSGFLRVVAMDLETVGG